jgi:hypothetical protein
MKTVKHAKASETDPMEFGKYVNVLIILNAMVKRFRESLVLIREQQAKTNVYSTPTAGQVNNTSAGMSV